MEVGESCIAKVLLLYVAEIKQPLKPEALGVVPTCKDFWERVEYM
jgi:hypothetical protein